VGPEEVRGPSDYFAYKFRRYAINPATGTLSFIGESMLNHINPWTEAVQSFTFHPSGKFLYVMLSGSKPETSQIQAYIVDSANGALTPTRAHSLGWSFRWLFAMTLHPNGKFAYVWCTFDSLFSQQYAPYGATQTYNIDVNGVLTEADNLALGPSESVTVEPSGRFLYSLNRGPLIFGYTINPVTGALSSMGALVGAGEILWSLTIDPNGKFVYVVDPKLSKIYTFVIDPVSGALSPQGASIPMTFDLPPPAMSYMTTVRTVE